MPAPKEKQTFYTIRIGEHFHDVTGRKRTPKGYVTLCIKTHPYSDKTNGYIFEHRIVMEMHLGRYLEPGEVVHHKNEIKYDNRLSNLELMEHAEHTIMHHTGSKRNDVTKEKLSISAKSRLKDKKNHPSYKYIDEKELLKAVENFGVAVAARKFGVTRKTIYNKLKDVRKDEAIWLTDS